MSHDASLGTIEFSGEDFDEISLDMVLCFKYLGIPISTTPYNLLKAYNENVIKKAKNYLNNILSLVRSGPDRSDLAFALWKNCALPSILYGAEIMPLSEGTLTQLEQCNTQVGKFILQVPRNSGNSACYIDAGLQPIRSLVAEKVITFSSKIFNKDSSYWPKIAMSENILLGNNSPYTRYLKKWKGEMRCFSTIPKLIKLAVRNNTIQDILAQQKATCYTTFPLCPQDKMKSWFKPKPWISDSVFSKTIASYRVCNIGLGNRGPAKDGKFYKLCPLCAKCNKVALNNEVCINIE